MKVLPSALIPISIHRILNGSRHTGSSRFDLVETKLPGGAWTKTGRTTGEEFRPPVPVPRAEIRSRKWRKNFPPRMKIAVLLRLPRPTFREPEVQSAAPCRFPARFYPFYPIIELWRIKLYIIPINDDMERERIVQVGLISIFFTIYHSIFSFHFENRLRFYLWSDTMIFYSK